MSSNSPESGVYTATVGPISQDQINAFGQLVGTFGRIHTDPEWAATTPLKGVIVQGMLILSPLHEVMYRIFGKRWISTGEVSCKIINSTRPGEETKVVITVDEDSSEAAKGSFVITRGDGTSVIIGDFTLGGADAR